MTMLQFDFLACDKDEFKIEWRLGYLELVGDLIPQALDENVMNSHFLEELRNAHTVSMDFLVDDF